MASGGAVGVACHTYFVARYDCTPVGNVMSRTMLCELLNSLNRPTLPQPMKSWPFPSSRNAPWLLAVTDAGGVTAWSMVTVGFFLARFMTSPHDERPCPFTF